jgi:hypothetical protein
MRRLTGKVGQTQRSKAGSRGVPSITTKPALELRELGLIAMAMEVCHRVAERLSARGAAGQLTEEQMERCRELSEAGKGMRISDGLEVWRRHQEGCERLFREIEGRPFELDLVDMAREGKP